MNLLPENIDTMSLAESMKHLNLMALRICAVTWPNTAGVIAIGTLLGSGHPPATRLTATAVLAVATLIDAHLLHRYKPQLKRIVQQIRRRD